MFFCQLTAILVTALLNATAEAASDNRELTRVFHQTISSEFKVIASPFFHCIRRRGREKEEKIGGRKLGEELHQGTLYS